MYFSTSSNATTNDTNDNQNHDNKDENEFFEIETDAAGTLSLREKRSGARFEGLLAFRDRGERGDASMVCAAVDRLHYVVNLAARIPWPATTRPFLTN